MKRLSWHPATMVVVLLIGLSVIVWHFRLLSAEAWAGNAIWGAVAGLAVGVLVARFWLLRELRDNRDYYARLAAGIASTRDRERSAGEWAFMLSKWLVIFGISYLFYPYRGGYFLGLLVGLSVAIAGLAPILERAQELEEAQASDNDRAGS
jgi:hypothetical protein